MIPVQLAEIAKIIQAEIINPELMKSDLVNAICHDSRQLKSGDAYLAIVGERFDGHEFCAAALEQGASCLIVSTPQKLAITQLVVADTRIALGLIAANNKRLAKVKTVAITGSCGKTTVKEMLLSICQQAGQTLATQGNFNNDIGVPLTLLRLSEQDEFAVIELGANHQGEIAYTAGLTSPDVALVNNVSAAHLEGFGSLLGVAQAKGEIYQALSNHGVAVVNADCDYVSVWQFDLAQRQQISFSQAPFADVYLQNLSLNEQLMPSFDWVYRGQSYQVSLPVVGKHNAFNALAAISCGLALGLTPQQINKGLTQTQSVNGRTNVHKLTEQLILIDDTYNANLASMKAAVDLLAQTQTLNKSVGVERKAIFVMGDMAEMGESSKQLHQEVGDYVRQNQIATFYTLGKLSYYAQLNSINEHTNSVHFESLDGLILKLKQDVDLFIAANHTEAMTILIKGSRSARMEQVVVAMKQYIEDNFKC